jgi:hypothetical protein
MNKADSALKNRRRLLASLLAVILLAADVSPGAFYSSSVGCIFGLAITTGTSPTTYAPDELVTRTQMAAFIARFYEADGPA